MPTSLGRPQSTVEVLLTGHTLFLRTITRLVWPVLLLTYLYFMSSSGWWRMLWSNHDLAYWVNLLMTGVVFLALWSIIIGQIRSASLMQLRAWRQFGLQLFSFLVLALLIGFLVFWLWLYVDRILLLISMLVGARWIPSLARIWIFYPLCLGTMAIFVPVILLDGRGPFGSFSRALELHRSHWRHTLVTLGASAVIALATYTALSYLSLSRICYLAVPLGSSAICYGPFRLAIAYLIVSWAIAVACALHQDIRLRSGAPIDQELVATVSSPRADSIMRVTLSWLSAASGLFSQVRPPELLEYLMRFRLVLLIGGYILCLVGLAGKTLPWQIPSWLIIFGWLIGTTGFLFLGYQASRGADRTSSRSVPGELAHTALIGHVLIVAGYGIASLSLMALLLRNEAYREMLVLGLLAGMAGVCLHVYSILHSSDQHVIAKVSATQRGVRMMSHVSVALMGVGYGALLMTTSLASFFNIFLSWLVHPSILVGTAGFSAYVYCSLRPYLFRESSA